jgi:competence protein ComEC
LLPFMGGVVAADMTAASLPPPWWLWAAAMAASVTGWFALSRNRDGPTHNWGLAVVTLSSVAGYLWLPLRSPVNPGWPHPAREVTVVLEIDQLFPPAPQRKTISGLGSIVSAEGAAAELAGQRVYFSAIRRVSTTPEVSGRYRFTALADRVPPGTGAFGFERYLDSLGIRVRLQRGHLGGELRAPSGFRRFCGAAQDRLERILRLGLDRHPELVSLYAAMLLGEKALLSPEQENAFMRSGVFHIFSISGLHVGVIALAILSGLALLRVPPRAARVVGLAVLWLYVQVTGASTPAERAFLMIGFVVASRVFHLPGNPLAGLAGAALVTLLHDPRQLFSTGFQMSYSVVTALVVMGGPLAERWQAAWQPWRDLPEADWGLVRHFILWLGRHALSAIAVTWTATLASVPSSVGNFGLLSPGALLANLVVVPLASLVMTAGFVSLLAGLAGFGSLAVLMNHAAGLVIVVMDWLVQRGTGLPGMYFAAEFREPWMGPAALVMVLGGMLLAAHPRLGPHGRLWLPPLLVAAVVILGVKFP